MKIFLDSLSHLGLDEIEYTEIEVYALVESEGVEIIKTDGKHSFYFTVEGVPFIAIPKWTKGLRRLFLILHEMAHHFRNYGKSPNQAYFHGLSNSKEELEADAFATVALCPKYVLASYDYLENHPNKFAKQIYENRKKLEFLYGV